MNNIKMLFFDRIDVSERIDSSIVTEGARTKISHFFKCILNKNKTSINLNHH